MSILRILRAAPPALPAPHVAWTAWRDVDPSESPAVSVFLPAGDDDDDLDQRVPRVLEQSVAPHEAVIVDTSQDGRHFTTVARLDSSVRGTALRYVRSPLLGSGALRRLADRLAAGNVKAFAGAGAVVPVAWIETIVEQVQRFRGVASA